MTDTICAIATAPGGALGIIRVSGPDAISIVSTLCPDKSDRITSSLPNTIHYACISVSQSDTSSKQEVIDEVLLSIFHAPHSYTGEDSVEISCHGSYYILNTILELLVHNGCRMARPGEFTMRAYINGKMDLSQAEAVADLIASSNRATHQMAISQLRGHFSSELSRLREQLLRLTSLLELELDFSDHEDLEFADRKELLELATRIDVRIMQLAHSFEIGQALKRGIPVAIVGKTNVGKSTLLNELLHDDRAIVSDIDGTTRDTIEEIMEIDGVEFRFIDTAGIRRTTDQIEKAGIDRTYDAIDKARIVLWLIDRQPTKEETHDILNRCQGKKIIPILNKTDLDENSQLPLANFQFLLDSCYEGQLVKISAKYGQGIETLKQVVYKAADIPTLSETGVIVTNVRHYDSLLRSHASIQSVIDGLQHNLSGDLLAEDLRLTLQILGEITGGQITPQETLNTIFSHFCVGK